MFVLDPASASLWLGVNGVWRDDPVAGDPTWSAGGSTGFHPVVQGRDPGDGGTLRALPAQFSYPVPPGVKALGFEEPDLSIYEAQAGIEASGPTDAALILGGQGGALRFNQSDETPSPGGIPAKAGASTTLPPSSPRRRGSLGGCCAF